jgi:hypothetical protein
VSAATVNLPPNISAGDMLIVSIVRDGIGTAFNWPEGWTLLATDENFARQEVACTIADGTEGATMTVTVGSQDSAHIAYRVTGHNGDTTTATIEAASADGASDAPDPPSLDPSGWDTADMLALVFIGVDSSSDIINDTPPSNYTNLLQVDGSDVQVASARRALTAASSEDPGAFSLSVSDNWTAVTVLIRAAAAGQPVLRRLHNVPFVGGNQFFGGNPTIRLG